MKKLLFAVVSLFLVLAFTVPVIADTKVGGILFTSLLWDYRSKERMGYDDSTPARLAATSGIEDNTLVHLFNCGHSRLYVNWTNEDKVGLFVELGLGGGDDNPTSDFTYVRHFYGWWDITPTFRLLAGETTTCFSPLNASDLLGFGFLQSGTAGAGIAANQTQAHAILSGYGNIYGEREPQIRGKWTFGPHFAEVAIGSYRDSDVFPAFVSNAVTQPGAVPAESTTVPRIDACVKIQAGPVAIYPSGYYLKRTWDTVAPGDDDNVTSWGLSLGAKTGFGPIVIEAEYNWTQNLRNSGQNDSATSFAAANSGAQIVNVGGVNRIYDTDSSGGFIDVGYKFGFCTFQVRYGYFESKNEDAPNIANHFKYKSQGYGASLPINVAKGFIIRPEVMFYDEGDEPVGGVNVDNGKEAQYGVQFQITF